MTWVWLPAPTRWLKTILTPVPGNLGTPSWSLRASGVHVAHIHTCRHTFPTWKIKQIIVQQGEWSLRDGTQGPPMLMIVCMHQPTYMYTHWYNPPHKRWLFKFLVSGAYLSCLWIWLPTGLFCPKTRQTETSSFLKTLAPTMNPGFCRDLWA